MGPRPVPRIQTGTSSQTLWANRDFYAGCLLLVIGVFVAIKGRSYGLGTLRQVGPGFLPVVLGTLLAVIGFLIAAPTLRVRTGADETHGAPSRSLEWRGWACILAAPFAFILFGTYLGLAPAIFACVFVAAFGDRTATIKAAAILALAMTAFGVVLFGYALDIPMPILGWSGL